MMMRQSSSRNQRSKKLKTKHALQLLVLLAISIWLLYQLKHTFDKKHTVNGTDKNSDENPIARSDEGEPGKATKFGRKDLRQNIENSNSNGERGSEIFEEDEEKDTELEQLLDDVEVRENGQEEEDRNADENGEERDEESADGEYGTNGEEYEEENSDGHANEIKENGTSPTVNVSVSVESGSASNQTVSVDLSVNQENNSATNVKVKEEVEKSGVQNELHAIQGSASQATNETTADALPHLSTEVVGNRDEIREE